MTLSIARLRSWQPPVLDSAAYDLGRSQGNLDTIATDLRRMLGRLADAWEGEAHDAAAGSVRRLGDVADDLVETILAARRTLFAAADALGAAKAQLERALDMAADNTITLTSHGVLMPTHVELPTGTGADWPSAAAVNATRPGAGEVNRMIHAALAAAEEADRDAAAAIRTLLAGLTPAERTAAGDEVLLTAVPRQGTLPADVLVWWQTLSPQAQAKMLATYPELLGNLDGMPFDVRVAANAVNIANAIEASSTEHERLRADLEDVQARISDLVLTTTTHAGALEVQGLQAQAADLEAQLAERIAEQEMYQRLLTEPTSGFGPGGVEVSLQGHQVVVFDPARGQFAEIVGTIGPRTRNIAVLIPGTSANPLNMDGNYDRAASFVFDERVNPPGSLAAISYLPGPMPQVVAFEAFDTSYAVNQARDVASFVNAIDNPSGAAVTVVGHSYGGSVVGAAETVGMHADRILHVESAGSGPHVGSVDDYAYPDTDRYTMTAPGDPIMYAQGANVGPLGHGADPGTLDGVVRLETGLMDATDPGSGLLEGGHAHSGVFDPGSTAHDNILAVMTGGEVSLYAPPDWVQAEVNGQIVDQWTYPMEDPSYRPPTMDVR